MNDEENHRDTDTGVGHIKSRPWMCQRHVQIEKKEIDDVTVKKSIGQIAEDAGK